jgi:hypothetical protein
VCLLVDAGQMNFDYETLSKLAKIDIRSDLGRSHFYRFRRAMIEEKEVQFTDISGYGYSIVPAEVQSESAGQRGNRVRRKPRMTNNITARVRWDEMNQEQRIVHAAIADLPHEIGAVFQNAAHRYRAIAKDPPLENAPKSRPGAKSKNQEEINAVDGVNSDRAGCASGRFANLPLRGTDLEKLLAGPKKKEKRE